jgi:predicted nucleotidyltransferase
MISFMNRLIQEHWTELEELCQRYHVRRLELFGSATGARFDRNRSDLDFLVEFEELESGQYAETYFGLLEDLEALFQRPIDLVMVSAIKNPYFLEAIASSRMVLYDAA